MKELKVDTSGMKQRMEEIDLLLAKLIKDYERSHRLPIESKIIPKFYEN